MHTTALQLSILKSFRSPTNDNKTKSLVQNIKALSGMDNVHHRTIESK